MTGITQNTDGDALQAQVRRLVNPNDMQSLQDSVLSYLRASVNGDQSAADAARDRAVEALAKAANISPDEARGRLQQVEQQARQTAEQAKQKARQAARAARSGAATAGIFGFFALLLGAVAAWFGGGFGAPHLETTRPVTSRG